MGNHPDTASNFEFCSNKKNTVFQPMKRKGNDLDAIVNEGDIFVCESNEQVQFSDHIQAEVESDDWNNAEEYAFIKRGTHSICRCVIENGKATAFFIRLPDTTPFKGMMGLLTNHHVLKGPAIENGKVITLHYRGKKDKKILIQMEKRRFRCTFPRPLDFTFVQVFKSDWKGNSASSWKGEYVSASEGPRLTPGDKLTMVQLFAAKTLSINQGRVLSHDNFQRLSERGVIPDDILHSCSTRPGSSGSMLIDIEGNVVALHAQGFNNEDPNQIFNVAIPIDKILVAIKEAMENIVTNVPSSSCKLIITTHTTIDSLISIPQALFREGINIGPSISNIMKLKQKRYHVTAVIDKILAEDKFYLEYRLTEDTEHGFAEIGCVIPALCPYPRFFEADIMYELDHLGKTCMKSSARGSQLVTGSYKSQTHPSLSLRAGGVLAVEVDLRSRKKTVAFAVNHAPVPAHFCGAPDELYFCIGLHESSALELVAFTRGGSTSIPLDREELDWNIISKRSDIIKSKQKKVEVDEEEVDEKGEMGDGVQKILIGGSDLPE